MYCSRSLAFYVLNSLRLFVFVEIALVHRNHSLREIGEELVAVGAQ